jgi:hypothetical protein
VETDSEGSTSSKSIEQLSRDVEIQRDGSLRVHMRTNFDSTEDCTVAEPVGVRESSPLSSVSSSFDAASWSGLSSIEEEDANDSDALGESEVEQPDAGNSITVDLSGGVSQDYQGETVDEEVENQMLFSGDGPDSDGFSELSEPSTVESDFDIQRMIAQDGLENTPAPEAARVTANMASEAEETQSEPSEICNSSSPISDGSEYKEEGIDVRMGGAGEPLSPIRERRSTVPTTVNITTADSETTEASVDGSQSTENFEAIMPAGVEHTNLFREPAATPPEPGLSGLSLKSMLQRLVPVNPWRKSQPSQVESQTHAAMRNIAEIDLGDAQCVESSKAGPQDSAAQQCHEAQDEANLEALTSPSTAPDMRTIPSPQPNPDVDQRVIHSVSSPGALLHDEKAPESEETRELLVAEACSGEHGETEETADAQPEFSQRSATVAAVPADGQRATSPSIGDTLAEVQMPGLMGATRPSISDEAAMPLLTSANGANDIYDNHEQRTDVQACRTTPPRPSTPESQFILQPFSAFMTPSPEHRARKMQRAKLRVSGNRLPTTKEMPPSALRNPWSSGKPNRRVSWAPLPREEAHEGGTPAGTRAASPPPMTLVEDLPTSKDADFQGHFNAVAKGANKTPARVPQTASQETDGTSGPYAVTESPTAPDEMGHAPSFGAPMEIMGGSGDGAGDEMDLTDEVFQDLEDLLRPWDLNAELEQARNEPAFGAIEIGV